MLSDERLGKFTASSINKLFIEGQGVTRYKYILEKAEEIVKGHFKDAFSSKQTEHGIFNENEGMDTFAQVTGLNVVYLNQEYHPINENCGATPDFKIVGFNDNIEGVGDIKCPFTSFFEQKMIILNNSKPEFQNCPKEYYYQVQMQMLALNTDVGYLVRYLTSANVDDYGNKYEYNLPLETRLFYKKITKDEQAQEKILKAVEKAAKERDILVEQLKKPFIYE